MLRGHADKACADGQDRQDDQGDPHVRGRLRKGPKRVGMSPVPAAEGQQVQAEHVEGGEHGRDETQGPDEVMAAVEGGGEDLALGPEARQGEDPGTGQGPDQESIGRHPHVGRQAAHPLDVVLPVQGQDHRSRSQEQEGLEEGMGDEMKHRGSIGPEARRQEHEAQLGNGGVGEDLLDIGLDAADAGGKDGRQGPDDRHQVRRVGSQFE